MINYIAVKNDLILKKNVKIENKKIKADNKIQLSISELAILKIVSILHD